MPETDSDRDSDRDLLDSLIERAQEGTSDRLDRRMHEAERLKAQEEASSQRRLEQMWLGEHERQRGLAQSQSEQRRQEQMLVRYVLIAAAIVVMIIIVLTVVLSLSGGDAAPEALLPTFVAYA